MLEWLRKRRVRKLENSGGLAEKRIAIEKTNAVADEVMEKMREILSERRVQVRPIPFVDRRTA